MKKRMISLFMSLVMCSTMIPISASAAEPTPENNSIRSNLTEPGGDGESSILLMSDSTRMQTTTPAEIELNEPVQTTSDEDVISTTSDEPIEYTLEDGGVLTFSLGTNENLYLSGYTTETGIIEIPETVTVGEGNEAKEYSVISIGNIFEGKTDLKELTVPSGVTSISSYAFRNCESVQTINLPDTIKTIGTSAFSGCSSLAEINIPTSLTYIDTTVFQNCSRLTEVTIPSSVTSIGNKAFYNCGLTEISIPASVTTIGEQAFWDCKAITSVTLQSGLKSIGYQAFYNCEKLESITIPETVTFIGTHVFWNCFALETADIQANITSIPQAAFSDCTSLQSVTIPSRVTSIGVNAFNNCGSLTKVDLPTGLKTISNGTFSNTGLTAVTIPSSVTSIGTNGFLNCEALETVTLNEGLQTLGNFAFSECSKLSGIRIPDTVTSLGGSVFSDCSSLTSVSLPSGITEIPDYTFTNCSNLESVTIPDSVTNIGESAFEGCSKLTAVSLPDGVTSIGENAFKKSGLTSITIPSDVSSISDFAFLNCEELTSAIIPAGVTSIGESAFQNCFKLQSVTLNEGLQSIGKYAFQACNALQAITIPDTVTSLGIYAFQYCDSMTSAVVGTGVTVIPDYAFNGCISLNSVELKGNVSSIGNNAFQICKALTSITIPTSVSSIGNSAFQSCEAMTAAYILGTDTAFGTNVFPITDTFAIHGYTGSTAQTYAENNNITFVPLNASTRTLTVSVTAPDGTPITEGFTVEWYDKNDQKLASTGTVLANANSEESYSFIILLGETLAANYIAPQKQTIAPTDDAAYTVQLAAAATDITVTGAVEDQDKTPITGAEVTAAYGSDEKEETTDTDGAFSVSVPRDVVTVTIRKDGYYTSQSRLILNEETGDTYDMGTISLTETVQDRIYLDVELKQAAKAGEEAITSAPVSLDTLRFALEDKNGTEITGFEVQGTHLVFQPNVVSANDTITITVSDSRGKYLSDSAEVTLNADKIGEATIRMIQKGGIVLGAISGPESTLNLFDNSGNCILSVPAVAGGTKQTLDAGTYTAVLLQKTTLLRSIPNLDYLNKVGLDNDDYLMEEINVENGVLKELTGTVPSLDESKLFYTVEANTSVTISKSAGMTTGELFTLRMEYELDSTKGVTAKTLQAVLPECVELPDGLALVDNIPKAYSYNENTRTVSIDVTGKEKATVHVYCRAKDQTGAFGINGYLALSNGALQPIGTAMSTVTTATVNVPSRTSSEEIIVSGITAPKSTVTLYDNGTKIGTTESNSAGLWSAEVSLAEPLFKYSMHSIYAVITNDSGFDVTTEDALVIYDERTVDLEKITMYYHDDFDEQKIVLDFTNKSTNIPYYMYSNNYPTYTFEVKFSGDTEILTNAYVVTEDSTGDETYVELNYDSSKGLWTGSHDYTYAGDIPAKIGAAYNADLYTIPEDEEQYEYMEEAYAVYLDAMSTVLNDFFTEYIVAEYDENTQKTTLYLQDRNKQEKVAFAESTINTETIPNDTTTESLEEIGYVPIEGNDMWIGTGSDENTTIYIDLKSQQKISIRIEPLLEETQATMFFTANYTATETTPIYKHLASLGENIMDALEKWNLTLREQPWNKNLFMNSILEICQDYDRVNGIHYMRSWNTLSQKHKTHAQILKKYANWLKQMGHEKCKDGNYKLDNEEQQTLTSKISEINGRINNFDTSGNQIISALTETNNCYFGYQAEGTFFTNGPMNIIYSSAGILGFLINNNDAKKQMELEQKTFNEIMEEIRAWEQWVQENSDCPKDPDPDEKTPTKDVNGAIDPSGYVYEAVPSNRLEGVTAVIYNDTSENKWDAEDYGQLNPQITGTNGSYYWGVPFGNWKVTFEKDGYQAADTSGVTQAVNGWLPVPPPQLNINVPMISTAAPQVSGAAATTSAVQLTFSQYMDIDSMKNAVTMTMNGASVPVTVIPLDAEYDAAGTTQYATKFEVKPVSDSLQGQVQATVATTAKNYAGTALGGGYTSPVLTPSDQSVQISMRNEYVVILDETTNVNITLNPALAGVTVTIEGAEDLLQFENTTAVTDANGSATFPVTGKAVGEGSITVRYQDASCTAAVRVQVAATGEVAPAVAKLANGAVLDENASLKASTLIYLSTAETDAQIWYTTDGTCPCRNGALLYTEPISFTQDTELRIAAEKDGVFSEIDVYYISIEKDTSRPPHGGGSSHNSKPSQNTEEKEETPVIPVTPSISNPFTDVEEADWFYNSVMYAYGEGLMKGTEQTRFTPYGDTSRAMVVSVLWRMEDCPAPAAAEDPFIDTESGQWYSDGINWAVQEGVGAGYGDGRFGTNDPVTRGQLVTFFYRYAAYKGYDLTATADLSAFADKDSVPDWAESAVKWAIGSGLISGRDDKRLDLQATATRAEFAAVLHRFINKYGV